MEKMIARVSAALLVAATALTATSASAATIVNLDSIPYDITVGESGEEKAVAIDPGERWTTHDNSAYVLVKNRKMRLDPGAEYAIWKGGSITKQSRGTVDRNR